MEGKSLARWRFELNSMGKSHWLRFYEALLGVKCSSPPRLYRTLNNYGFWPLFDAIVATSERELEGDPLNYVTKIASTKWKEAEIEEQEEEEYLKGVEEAKKRVLEENKKLAKKLEKLK